MIEFLSDYYHMMNHHVDKERAKKMKAYLKSDYNFYGISAPIRKSILRELFNKYTLTNDELKSICWKLWNSDKREDLHAALDIIERRKKRLLVLDELPFYLQFFERADNWDTLDMLASNVFGYIYLKHREMSSIICSWTFDSNMWIRRAAIISQIKHRLDTDTDVLTKVIEPCIYEKEFFIRKAIGWALRSYGDFNPDWVTNFVNVHPNLSPLSKKEALRKIR